MGMGMGFGIWEWDGNGIWDLGGIMTNGMGWDGYGMGFDTNGNWDSPIPISMGGKYTCRVPQTRIKSNMKLI